MMDKVCSKLINFAEILIQFIKTVMNSKVKIVVSEEMGRGTTKEKPEPKHYEQPHFWPFRFFFFSHYIRHLYAANRDTKYTPQNQILAENIAQVKPDDIPHKFYNRASHALESLDNIQQSFLKELWKTFKVEIIISIIMSQFALLCRPAAILTAYFLFSNLDDEKMENIGYGIIIILLLLGELILRSNWTRRCAETAIRFKTFMISSLLHHFASFHYQRNEKQKVRAQIINLIAMMTDFEDCFQYYVGMLSTILVFVSIYAFFGVILQIGAIVICLIGFATTVMVVVLSLKNKNLNEKRDKDSEQSYQILSDIINQIKNIKTFGWQYFTLQDVEHFLTKEKNFMRKTKIVQKQFMMLVFSIIQLALIISYYLIFSDPKIQDSKYLIVKNILTSFLLSLLFFQNTSALFKGFKARTQFLRIYQKIVALLSLKSSVLMKNEDGNHYSPVTKGMKRSKNFQILDFENYQAFWEPNQQPASLIVEKFSVNDESGVYGVTGLSGSGKSMFIKSIMGIVPIYQGHIEVLGSVSYCGANPCFMNGTVRQNILMGKYEMEQKYKKVLQICELDSFVKSLPQEDNTQIKRDSPLLSYSIKMKIELARCLYHDADIYLIEEFEPFTNFMEILTNSFTFLKKKLVFIVSGTEKLLDQCDKVIKFQENYFMSCESNIQKEEQEKQKFLESKIEENYQSEVNVDNQKPQVGLFASLLMWTQGNRIKFFIGLLLSLIGFGVFLAFYYHTMSHYEDNGFIFSNSKVVNSFWVVLMIGFFSFVIIFFIGMTVLFFAEHNSQILQFKKVFQFLLLSKSTSTLSLNLNSKARLLTFLIRININFSGSFEIVYMYWLLSIGLIIYIITLLPFEAIFLGLLLISQTILYCLSEKLNFKSMQLIENKERDILSQFDQMSAMSSYDCILPSSKFLLVFANEECILYMRSCFFRKFTKTAIIFISQMMTWIFFVMAILVYILHDFNEDEKKLSIIQLTTSFLILWCLLNSLMENFFHFSSVVKEYAGNLGQFGERGQEQEQYEKFKTQKRDKMEQITSIHSSVIFEGDQTEIWLSLKNIQIPIQKEKTFFTIKELSVRYRQKMAIVCSQQDQKILLSLLLRLQDPPEGAEFKIKANRGENSRMEDILKMSRSSAKERIAYVPREQFIFWQKSIRENLDPSGTKSDKKIWKIFHRLEIKMHEEELPKGLNTKMKDFKERLTKKQIWLFSVARALLKDCEVIVIEDAPLPINSEADCEIEKLFKKESTTGVSSTRRSEVFLKKTVLMFTRRVELMTNFDEILVMRKGQIFRKGPLSSLLKERIEEIHLTSNLYHSQLKIEEKIRHKPQRNIGETDTGDQGCNQQ